MAGNVGRRSSFEITINSKLVFSKLQLGGFPKEEDVRRAIQEAKEGLEPKIIEECAQESCIIL